MSRIMTEREDMDMLAAEYVLGTLDAEERNAVSARRQREGELDSAIMEWENRLAPMLAQVGDAAPRADLLADIQKTIEERSAGGDMAGSNVVALRRQVSRWRALAMGATALAASLVGVMVFSSTIFPPANQQFVAVFQDGDAPPRFVLSINLETRELTVRPVAAELPEGKTYQLWIKADQLGPSPQSLGLLDKPERPTRKELRQFDPMLLQKATFGISIEPEGGSKTGKPSAGALHGKLIPATF